MKHTILYLTTLVTLGSCGSAIQNKSYQVIIEPGTEIIENVKNTIAEIKITTPKPEEETTENKFNYTPEIPKIILQESTKQYLIGYWLGDFKNANREEEHYKYEDPDFAWSTSNKINISIDEIIDSTVIGHSVVAGNNRPFIGTLTKNASGITIHAKEPGNNKYDGEFTFTINKRTLSGIWTAYNEIEINKREYELVKKHFSYNPNQSLERSTYVNWYKNKKRTKTYDYGDGDIEKITKTEFEVSTKKIYEINASNSILKKEDIENLKRADISIIRNTIYARHGYSFKNKPLRVFFDNQKWYIPIHTSISEELTAKEKANIKLLLKYENNAAKYYQSFGRG